MTTINEGRRNGEFIGSLAPGYRSRENVIVASGQNLKAGHVLGRITAASVTVRYTGTGNGALTPDASTPLLAGVQEGRYVAVAIEPGSNVGQFEVFDPQGVSLGLHTVAGSAFANQIKFAIADGATDFVAGDQFEIFVKAGTMTADGGNTGNGVGTLYQTLPGCQPGSYTAVCTAAASNSGTFTITAPDGSTIGTATVGTRFTDGGLDLLIADGGTDFIVGDKFSIAVTRGKVKEYNPANTDGSGVPYGLLYAAVDATGGDAKGAAIVRDAEFNAAEVTWFSGATNAQKSAAHAGLALRGVLAR